MKKTVREMKAVIAYLKLDPGREIECDTTGQKTVKFLIP